MVMLICSILLSSKYEEEDIWYALPYLILLISNMIIAILYYFLWIDDKIKIIKISSILFSFIIYMVIIHCIIDENNIDDISKVVIIFDYGIFFPIVMLFVLPFISCC